MRLLLLFLLGCVADLPAPKPAETDADGDGHPAIGDCDDADPTVFPGAQERCNDGDDDCDEAIDNGVLGAWFRDEDLDGYGDSTALYYACLAPDGYVSAAGDCDDRAPDVHPGAPEACDEPLDLNCDGSSGFADLDRDGAAACLDCDDADPLTFPGAPELCNGHDDDCDGEIDGNNAVETATWYLDADGDGYGVLDGAVSSCVAPAGTVAEAGDCDDTRPDRHPGADEPDCADPTDYNCDGTVGYTDADADSFAACEDCDDADATASPAAIELCNGKDDNCVNGIDESSAADAQPVYADTDADGYGDPASIVTACTLPAGYTQNNQDCLDTRSDVSPSGVETCDGVDEDCDGEIDEDAADAPAWYLDLDDDGWGATATVFACDAPDGFSAYTGDCDDTLSDVSPGSPETCGALDEDCDGTINLDSLDAPDWYTDADGDGYGDPATGVAACDAPPGTVSSGGDCDDSDATIAPEIAELCDELDQDCDGLADDDAHDAPVWYPDLDLDGHGDPTTPITACEAPIGALALAGDCDDADPTISPEGEETCDGVDQDCDGLIDNNAADALVFYADDDTDGYGDPTRTRAECAAPRGYVSDNLDCDDARPTVNPGAAERCNGRDDDCDGATDTDATDGTAQHPDADGDGFGDSSATPITACDAVSGYVTNADDCDDGDAAVSPDGRERCGGGDENCDGVVDEPGAFAAPIWYTDGDGDGHGAPGLATRACTAPSNAVSAGNDCDDTDPGVHPGAAESCAPGDSNCDGDDDLDAVDPIYAFADVDGDGYGDPEQAQVGCVAPSGFVADDQDCDDADPARNPAEPERCDGLDQDCDTRIDDDPIDALTLYADADRDGYGDPAQTSLGCEPGADWVVDNTDCDDSDAGVSPGAIETCTAGDEDCDGISDNATTDVPIWYVDLDGDGYGDPTLTLEVCDPPDGWSALSTDCDDTDAAISPRADERCDTIGVDDDCDGEADEPDAIDAPTFWPDTDGDGYGTNTGGVTDCVAPAGSVEDNTDCDDTLSDTWPGAPERCDSLDQSCDGDPEAGAVDTRSWYADLDGDNFHGSLYAERCDAPTGDYAGVITDCDDTDASINPWADEICDGAGIDEDCNGYADTADPGPFDPWGDDLDGDGYADDAVSNTTCPSAEPLPYGDCDDSDASVSPDMIEVCGNLIDDNCDGDPEGCEPLGDVLFDDADRMIAGVLGEFPSWIYPCPDLGSDGYGDFFAGSSVTSAGKLWLYSGPDTDIRSQSSSYATFSAQRGVTDFGQTVAVLDMNADGFHEVVIGAPNLATPSGIASGAAYVYYGPFLGAYTASGASTRVVGAHSQDRVGISVASAGDTDGDGTEDLLVGSQHNSIASVTANGAIALLRGPLTAGDNNFFLGDLLYYGGVTGQMLGGQVAAGDLDGDGISELIAHGGGYDSTTAFDVGVITIFPGSGTRVGDTADADTWITGETTNDRLGAGLDVRSDLDGDGLLDLVATAPTGTYASTTAGYVAVYLGASGGLGAALTVSDAAALLVGTTTGDNFGISVATLDLDQGGISDLVIGVPGYDDGASVSAGQALLFYGPLSGTLDRDDAEWRVTGQREDNVGGAMATTGDLDADGYPDLAIGATGWGSTGAVSFWFGGGI